MLARNTTPKDRNASQAAGTCTYISRCTSPCSASGGTTNSPRAPVSANPTRVVQPSRRCAPLVPSLTSRRSMINIRCSSAPSTCCSRTGRLKGAQVALGPLQRLQVLDEISLLGAGEPEVEGLVVVLHHGTQ